MDLKLADTVVVITGAAAGLGASLASQFSQEGARVIGIDVAAEQLTALRDEGVLEEAFTLDLENLDDIGRAFDHLSDDLGRIDTLINAAGITHLSPAFEFGTAAWTQVIQVNLSGTFFAAQAAAKVMRDYGGGSIVNFSSIAGSAGLPRTAAYCASKGGVDALTRALAAEWAPHNIRVNAVAPSWFDTDMGRKVNDRELVGDSRLERVPLGRIGIPTELSPMVLLLASPLASMMTGGIYPVDGGFLAV